MTGLTRAVKAELAAENLHWLRASRLASALMGAGKPWCLLTLKDTVTPFDLECMMKLAEAHKCSRVLSVSGR